MLGAGFGIAAHYHLMGNCITRAPHFVRAILLPVATAGGVGMICCAVTGNLLGGLLASGIAVAAVILVNIAAWDAGVIVTPSGWRELDASDQRAVWREGEGAR